MNISDLTSYINLSIKFIYMKNTPFSISILIACVGLLFGCSVSPSIGDKPSDLPPRLVEGKQRDASGRILYEWDRPAAFGKAVGEQKILGDAACLMGRPDLEALGFHPLAKDADGIAIPGGGYFCGVKSLGDRSAPEAPMLIRTNGILGWNQPNLFGAVPAEHKARGDAVCAKAQSGFEAAAYHPKAKNEAGDHIGGGGFFCAPKRIGAKEIG